MLCRRLFRFGPTIAQQIVTPAIAKSLGDFGHRVQFVDVSLESACVPDPKAEFAQRRIPGSIRFDIRGMTDPECGLKYGIPTLERMQKFARRYDLSPETDIVCVYTQANCMGATRGWWTFKNFGYTTAILNGGIAEWSKGGLTVESQAPVLDSEGELVLDSTGRPTISPSATPETDASRAKPKQPEINLKRVPLGVDIEYVKNLVESSSEAGHSEAPTTFLLDARLPSRFQGSSPEPLPGVAAGHIPGSINIPFTQLHPDGDVTRFPSVEELLAVYEGAGIKIKDIVSGIEAKKKLEAKEAAPKPVSSAAPVTETAQSSKAMTQPSAAEVHSVVVSDHGRSPLFVTTCNSGITACDLAFTLNLLGIPLSHIRVYDGSWCEWGSKTWTRKTAQK